MSLRVWSWLLSLAVLWGGSFFFAKIAVATIEPLTVVFARVALAALALNIVIFWTGRTLFGPGTPWGSFFAMGFLNNVLPFSLIFWAQTQIPSGLAAILNAMTPFFIVLAAHVLTADERITPAKAIGLAIGFSGVIVLIGPDLLFGVLDGVSGQIACLLAAVSYAFAGIYGRRFKTMGLSPVDAAAGQVTASSILILPIMAMVDQPWTLRAAPSYETWAALLGLALLSTALAYLLYFRILAAAGATNLLLVTFLIPVTAILLATVFLDEQLALRHIAGMAFIGAGMAAIDGRIVAALRVAK